MTNYLEGWKASRIPVVTIENPQVNPFAKYNVEMGAIMGCALPGGSFKLPGIASMVDKAQYHHAFTAHDTLVEASSGRAAALLYYLTQQDIADFKTIMKPTVPNGKRNALRVAGITVMQPEPGKTAIQTARAMGGGGWINDGQRRIGNGGHVMYGYWGRNGDTVNLDQYGCPYIADGYEQWAALHILKETTDFDVLVVGIGTGGTAIGLGRGLRRRMHNRLTIVGAMCADKEDISGMRDEYSMGEIGLPWQTSVDHRVYVERKTAILCMPWLARTLGTLIGLSGCATYVAAYRFLKDLIKQNKLETIRNQQTGKIRILFLVHDDGTPYVNDCFHECGPGHFNSGTVLDPSQIAFVP